MERHYRRAPACVLASAAFSAPIWRRRRWRELAGKPVHVLEDDAVLSPYTAPAIDFCIQTGALAKYDVVFTEILVSQDVRALKAFKSLYDKVMGAGTTVDVGRLQMLDLANLRFTCMSSYVVNPASVSRLLDRYNRGWDAGPVRAIDNYLRDEVNAGRLRAACIFPFVTTIDPGSIVGSTVARGDKDQDQVASQIVMSLLRHSYFVGRDLDWAHARLGEILDATVGRKPDSHRLLLEKAMGFILSDHFRAF
jgi:hypothetical protein